MTLNFTVGPVQSNDYVCSVASEQVPYFRNTQFSSVLFECEDLIKQFTNAPSGSKVLFITGSGTASMEAAVSNIFSSDDKLLIINGGTFGNRFVDIVKCHRIPYKELPVAFGKDISLSMLEEYYDPSLTGVLVNVDETSSGVHYNVDVISTFCRKHNLLLVSDIISSFLADYNDMSLHNVDVYIIGSQKALACHPGISILVLSPRAIDRICNNDPLCYYLDLKKALRDAERGQTPFTPAVSIINQIHSRLLHIGKQGGVSSEIERIASIASYFRSGIRHLPLSIVAETPSNAVTALYVNQSAKQLFIDMKSKYDIWICPNGGQYSDTVFRIGHIGDISFSDIDYLIKALTDLLGNKNELIA